MDNIDNALEKIAELGNKEAYRCPRCGGFIPNNETPGAYPGALSRITRDPHVAPIYICSACGTDEAMLQFTVGRCQIPAEWPVTRSFDLPEPEEMARMMDKLQEDN